MIILGIDPGTATTGYGLIETQGNRFRYIEHGIVATEASLALPVRLGQISKGLQDIITHFKPDQLAVEQLFFSKNARTALSVGHARGVVLLTGIQNNLSIGEYTPLQVKQAVAGYGRADKQQVQKMVTTLLNLQEIPRPDDAADALAVAICHAHSYRYNSMVIGEKQ